MVSEGYPLRFSANNSKGEYIAMGLREAGCTVTMTDGPQGTKGQQDVQTGVSARGIPYHIFPRKGKVRTLCAGLVRLWRVLRACKRRGAPNHLIMTVEIVPLFWPIVAMAWLLGYSRSALFHEWYLAMPVRSKGQQWERHLRLQTFGYGLNLILPISHFLAQKAERFRRPTMLLPVLADYQPLPTDAAPVGRHFAYCCGAGYLLRCTIVIDAFRQFVAQTGATESELVLIVVGNDSEIAQCKAYVERAGRGLNITLRHQIPYAQLQHIYQRAVALIVPLDPDNLQDKARFSQKIAEYIATGRPMITNATGEIPHYFTHRVSAWLCPYTPEGFAEAMGTLYHDRATADAIGRGGWEVGHTHFHYAAAGRALQTQIEALYD